MRTTRTKFSLFLLRCYFIERRFCFYFIRELLFIENEFLFWEFISGEELRASFVEEYRRNTGGMVDGGRGLLWIMTREVIYPHNVEEEQL